MNPDTNRFELATEETPANWMRLSIGEEIVIKDYVFKVESIETDRLVLAPDRKASRQQRREAKRAARR